MRRPLFDLREKVQLLGTALYTSFMDGELRIPVCVIRDFEMRDPDIISFRVKKPYRNMEGMEQRFHSRLDFYNKQFDFYLQLSGYSEVRQREELDPAGHEADEEYLKIDMRIIHVDYYAASEHSAAGWWRQQLLHPKKTVLRKLWEQMNLSLRFPISIS